MVPFIADKSIRQFTGAVLICLTLQLNFCNTIYAQLPLQTTIGFLPQNLTSASRIDNVRADNQVQKYHRFTIYFNSLPYSNPFDPRVVNISAELISPSGKVYHQSAFYLDYYHKTDGGGYNEFEHVVPSDTSGWQVRFAPNETGIWKWRLHAFDQHGNMVYPLNGYKSFECLPSTDHGPVRKANSNYLKYEDGTPFYPLGCSSPLFKEGNWRSPGEYGTNHWIPRLNDLANAGANFVRIDMNFLDGLNLFGHDWETGKNYYTRINQRTSWQLDSIMAFTNQQHLEVLLSLFAFNYFIDYGDGWHNQNWDIYNPYNTEVDSAYIPAFPDHKGSCTTPYEFYNVHNPAFGVEKNYIRYVVSRWGYAANMMGYELMDEADGVEKGNPDFPLDDCQLTHVNENIFTWHSLLYYYIHSIDPANHLVTTAFADYSYNVPVVNCSGVSEYVPLLWSFMHLDMVQKHHYIVYPDQGEYFCHLLFQDGNNTLQDYPNKPFMDGEMGWYNPDTDPMTDPHLYDLHNNLWVTLMANACGMGSIWEIHHLETYNAFSEFTGVSAFLEQLPQFTPQWKGHEDLTHPGYLLYYKQKATGDSLYGWVQDQHYTFQYLYNHEPGYLASLSLFQRPTYSSDLIALKLPVSEDGLYKVTYYNTETGNYFWSITLSAVSYGVGNDTLYANVPSSYLSAHYGDIAFSVRHLGGSNPGLISENQSDPIAMNGNESPIQQNIKSSNTFYRIYPNPALDILHIRTHKPISDDTRYTIYDATGEQVTQGVWNSEGLEIKVPINELAPGTYHIQIISSDNTQNLKFVKL